MTVWFQIEGNINVSSLSRICINNGFPLDLSKFPFIKTCIVVSRITSYLINA
jgi:hypothetical protein